MAILKEVWLKDIQEVLRSGADFLDTFTDLSELADNNGINVPQSGAGGTVTKNANVFPLTASQRVDIVKRIPVDSYNTSPVSVPTTEDFQASYNKRNSVMGAQARQLAEYIGDTALQNICPTAAGRKITALGAKITYEDILAVAKAFDLDKVPAGDRYLALPTDMYYDLLDDAKVAQAYSNGMNTQVIGSGKVTDVAGIKIWQRPTVATLAGAPAAVAYHKDFVAFGKADLKLFVDSGDNGEGNPLFLGAVMTAQYFFGADNLRTDDTGTFALVRP